MIFYGYTTICRQSHIRAFLFWVPNVDSHMGLRSKKLRGRLSRCESHGERHSKDKIKQTATWQIQRFLGLHGICSWWICPCTIMYVHIFCIMFHHVNPHNSTHHRRRNSVYMPYTSHNEAEPFLCFHSTWIHVTTGLTQDYPVQFAYLRLLGHWWREVQADGQSHERMPKINRLLNPLDSYIHILHPISFPV